MKLTPRELEIIADELRTKYEEYQNFDDVDDKYLIEIDIIIKKLS